MRVKTALAILVAVNVVWAAAFLGYLRRPVEPPAPAASPAPSVVIVTNTPPPVVLHVTNFVPVTNEAVPAKSLASTGRRFTWRDVTNDAYLDYVARLRAAGAPEQVVRQTVLADVNELFDQRRLEHAIQNDAPWWRAETYLGIIPMKLPNSPDWDEPRRELLAKILGEDGADTMKLSSLNGRAADLTGPVLGALPTEVWNAVQEICVRSAERYHAIQAALQAGGTPASPMELAKLREQTRVELAKVLPPAPLEEFLLRYSQNASALRSELRGVELSPEEFRKLFRAIDPLEHRVQTDYGGPEALSARQREELQAQRDRAAREALTPERYAEYLLATRDAQFKQAQLMAMQYSLNGRAVRPLHEMQKDLEARRVQISANPAWTEEQRTLALQALGLEHQQRLQKILSDTAYRP